MNDFGTVIAVKDDHPVSEGHMLILTKRHTIDYFSINEKERLYAEKLIRILKNKIEISMEIIGEV